MERFGRAALKPIGELSANGGGAPPRNVKDCHLTVAPRLIWSKRQKEPGDPVRIYSDAAGAGELASVSLFPNNEGRRPTLLIGLAAEELRGLAATCNKIYIFGLFAAIAAVFQPRDRLWGRGVVLFVDNEAARAALTRGISRNKDALMLSFSLWAAAAQYDVAIWTDGGTDAGIPRRRSLPGRGAFL